MRRSSGIIIALILINFIVSAVFIALLPAEIPTKFDFHGNVTSYGSKLTMLVIPVSILLCGGVAATVIEKLETAGEKDKRLAGIIVVIALLLLTANNVATLITTYSFF